MEFEESSASVAEGVEHLGWVECDNLAKLKSIHMDLVRFRDRGVDDHNVGWKASWLAFTEVYGMEPAPESS